MLVSYQDNNNHDKDNITIIAIIKIIMVTSTTVHIVVVGILKQITNQ